jgi:hypothetical protein
MSDELFIKVASAASEPGHICEPEFGDGCFTLMPVDRDDIQRAVLAGMVQYTLLTNDASISEQLVAVDGIVSETVDTIMSGGLEADRD